MLQVHASSPCSKSMPPVHVPSTCLQSMLPALASSPCFKYLPPAEMSTSTMAPALSLPTIMVPEPSLPSTMDPAPSTFTMDPALTTSTMDTATSTSTMAPAQLLSSTMVPALSLSNMMAPAPSPSSVSTSSVSQSSVSPSSVSPSSVSTSSVSPSSVSPSSVSPSSVSTSSAVPRSSQQYPAVPRSTQQYTENPEDVAETAAKEKADKQAKEQAEEKDAKEAAAKDTEKRKVDKKSSAREGTKKKVTSEKTAPKTLSLWPVLLLPFLLAMPLLHLNMPREHCSTASGVPGTPARPRWTATRTPASRLSTRTPTASGSPRTPASWSSSPTSSVTTPTPVMPSRDKMMLTRDKVHVWPNSHPRGGGGQIHSSCMKNHRVSLYVDIDLSWCLPSHHSTKPDKYDGSARVSLQEGILLVFPDSTDQSQLSQSPTKLHEEHIPLATTPPHRKTSPQDISNTMDNHCFSPTVTTATLKRHEPIKMDKHKELLTKVYMKTNGDSPRLSTSKDHLKKVKYKSSNMKSSNRPHRKKDTYDVHGNVKFGNLNKTSTPKDQLKMAEYEASHMESLNQLYIKRNNYDVPSSVSHSKNAPSISINLYLSPNMMKKDLKILEYEQSVLNTNMMICSSVYLNSYQAQKRLQSQVKTSSDSDATQDLARDEGLHPRGGITRHHALPVPQRADQHAVTTGPAAQNISQLSQVI